MNVFIRIAVVVLCFFAAIACYIFAAPAGGLLFIVLGLVLEGLFWAGIFKKRKKKVLVS